eukprot:1271706-Prymnesium_polylepis.1
MGAPGFGRGAVWCKPEWGAGDPWCGGNPFAPENLQLMLQGHRGRDQINEVCASSTSSAMRHRGGAVVIDTDCINDNLPRSIEAIFYPSACGRGSQCRRDAEQVHQTFRREFGLSAEKSPL